MSDEEKPTSKHEVIRNDKGYYLHFRSLKCVIRCISKQKNRSK
jgi:hypothetical protein